MAKRLFYSGIGFALLTFGVLIWLISLSVQGHSVADADRPIVFFLLALGGGLSVGALGGSATASGNLKLPVLDTPLKVAFTGGVAVFLVIVFSAPRLFSQPRAVDTIPRLDQARGAVVGQSPRRLVVEATFEGTRLQADRRLLLVLGRGSGCSETKSRQTVDYPLEGRFRSFVLAQESEITCARLVLQDTAGAQLAESGVVQVDWR